MEWNGAGGEWGEGKWGEEKWGEEESEKGLGEIFVLDLDLDLHMKRPLVMPPPVEQTQKHLYYIGLRAFRMANEP